MLKLWIDKICRLLNALLVFGDEGDSVWVDHERNHTIATDQKPLQMATTNTQFW